MADPGTEDPLRERDAGIGEMEKSESESCSVVPDSVTLWTRQAMGFSRPECWSGQPFPSAGHLPNPGLNPGLPHCWRILCPPSSRVRRREAVNEDQGIVALDDRRDRERFTGGDVTAQEREGKIRVSTPGNRMIWRGSGWSKKIMCSVLEILNLRNDKERKAEVTRI